MNKIVTVLGMMVAAALAGVGAWLVWGTAGAGWMCMVLGVVLFFMILGEHAAHEAAGVHRDRNAVDDIGKPAKTALREIHHQRPKADPEKDD